jgi:WD40 repeat protein
LGGIVWQWRRVEAQRQQTEHALIRSEEQQYAAHVALAQNLMEQRHFDRARALLEEDSLSRYRGWEWGWLQRQCHQDLATLNHPVAVTSLAFSPDGRYLVTGSFDRLVRLWNWEEGKVERVFQGHEDHAGVWPGSFSPDGKRLVSMSWDRTARIWDVASGRELLRLAHPVALDGAQFSPDGTTVATGGWDGVVRVWNAETGEQLRQATNGDSVLFVAFSPDGRRIAYAGGPRFSTEVGHDTAVKIWDLATDHKQALLGHRVTVMCVAFSPDGKTLASGSFDGAVKLWDVATGRELPAVNTGFSYRIVFTLAFSPDGQQLAVGGMQGLTPRAEIFNLASRERVRTLEGHSVGVRSVAFSPDGSQIATASFGDQVRVWATTNEPDYLSLEGHNAAVWAVACSGDSRRIATGSFDKTVKIWDAESGSLIQTIPVGLPVLSLALSADGKRLVTPAPEANATVWDVAGGQPLLTLKGHSKTVMAVALSTDGRWIVTGSKDNTVRLWNTTNGVFLRAFPGHSNWVLSVAFSPDGQRVLTGSADRTAIIWDTESGRRLQTLAGHSDRVLSVAYSPDGQRVATGSSGGERKVRLWDVHTGAVFWQVEHMDGVTGLAFSPDGTRLARAAGSATRDDTFMKEFSVAITDVRTGYELLQLAGHSNCVASVAFSPDGTRLVTGSGDNTARIRTASPWQEERVAGQTTPSLTDRFERYKRQQRRARLPASNQVTAATVSRTNVFAFCGEVSMPGQRVPKTRPMLPIPARDARAGHQQIDLSVTYNATLAETWQPVTELRHVDWSLAALPRGLQVFGGIQFDLRGLIQLGRAAPDWEWPTYPEQVRITVGQKFNRLHVLHGSSYSTSEGATIGTYRLRYADGSEHVLDIVYGRDLAYWVGPADAKLSEGEAGQAEVAWTGEDPSREPGKEPRSLRLFRRTYQNPHPEIEVARIDFDSAMSKCGPFLVAMTVE